MRQVSSSTTTSCYAAVCPDAISTLAPGDLDVWLDVSVVVSCDAFNPGLVIYTDGSVIEVGTIVSV